MSSIRLAYEARLATRQVFASLPHNVRISAALRALVRLAYSKADVQTFGLLAIHAMVKSGVEGSLFETPMETVAEYLRKRSPQINKLASAWGKALLNKGLRKYKNHPELEEATLQHVIDKLIGTNPIKPGMLVPQVAVYLSNMIWMAASTIARGRKLERHDKERHAPTLEEWISDPSSWSSFRGVDIRQALDRIKRDPNLADDEGNPRMYQYLSGLANGHSEAEIADALGVTRQGLYKWVTHPTRQKALQKYLAPFIGQ